MENLTEAQIQAIAARVRNILRAESKGVGELPVVSSLDGVLTLPALRMNGGIPEVVEAPVDLLQDVATDAVADATKKAIEAASNATNAATKASSAADTANKEAASVNAAKSEALAAAARAGSTATTAEAEIEKMKQLQESISGAASLAPTRMELTYTRRITQRNPYVQRIVAKMFPSYSLQNVLFLGDDVAVSVDPAGVVTPLKIGTSRIHVIPTQATHLYKTINVEVQAPSVRLTGGGKIRVDSKGRIRLT